jgi:hypothetical protein
MAVRYFCDRCGNEMANGTRTLVLVADDVEINRLTVQIGFSSWNPSKVLNNVVCEDCLYEVAKTGIRLGLNHRTREAAE